MAADPDNPQLACFSENKICSLLSKGVSINFKIGNYNVNRFWQCDLPEELRKKNSTVAEWSKEQLSIFHWNNRAPRIAKAIVANDLDFVALEELRRMDTSSINTLLSQPEIDKRYRFVEWVGNGTPLCMTNGLLYDYRKWFLCTQNFVWLSETPSIPSDFNPNGFGRIMGVADFLPIDQKTMKIQLSKGGILQICVVHLDVGPEEQKHKQISAICKRSFNKNSVILGDFNFFDDLEGGAMRQKMEERFFNAGKGAIYSQSRKKAERTFFPYSYEPNFEQLRSTNSVLDHIFLNPESSIEVVGNAWLDTKTYGEGDEPEELSNWDALPSDHLLFCLEATMEI